MHISNFWKSATPEKKQEMTRKRIETFRKNKQKKREELNGANEAVTSLKDQINKLEQKLQFLKKVDDFIFGKKMLDTEVFYSEDQIIKNSFAWNQDECGVYFLIKNKKIVYVGQSVNVFVRIKGHSGKEFDSVTIVRCNKNALDKLESLYIHFLKPELNGYMNGKKSAPIRLKDLFNEL